MASRQHQVNTYREMVEIFIKYKDHEYKNGFTPLTITFENQKIVRTNQQNKFFWAMIGEVKEALLLEGNWMTSKELAEYFKDAIGFTDDITLANGRVMKIRRSLAASSPHATKQNFIMLCNLLVPFAHEWAGITLTNQMEKE